MGQSLSTDLAYGLILGSDEEDYLCETVPIGWARIDYDAEELAEDQEEVGIGSWEEELGRKRGLVDAPWVSQGEDAEGHARWSKLLDDRRRVVKDEPVEIDSCGISDYPCWSVRVKESTTTVYGAQGTVDPEKMIVDPTWDDQILAFMELLELPVPGDFKIGWFITSSYG